MPGYLNTYLGVLEKYRVVPTFPIVANLIRRHPQFIREFNDRNIDFAIHYHKDFAPLSVKQQRRQIEMAIKVSKEVHLRFCGFRCPYLRWIPITSLEEGLSKTYEWLTFSRLNEMKQVLVKMPFQAKSSSSGPSRM